MTTMTADFLPDGSIKLTVDGEVPMEIHDAVEENLDDLAEALGGDTSRERNKNAEHRHGHHQHKHVKA